MKSMPRFLDEPNNTHEILMETIYADKIKSYIEFYVNKFKKFPEEVVIAVNTQLSLDAVQTCFQMDEIKSLAKHFQDYQTLPQTKKMKIAEQHQKPTTKRANSDLLDATKNHIYAYLCDYSKNGMSNLPSAKEIARHFRISINTVDRYLNALAKDGLLQTGPLAYFLNIERLSQVNLPEFFGFFNHLHCEEVNAELLEALLSETSFEADTKKVIDYIYCIPLLHAYSEFKNIDFKTTNNETSTPILSLSASGSFLRNSQ